MSDISTMSPRQVAAALEVTIGAQLPTFLWGAPGVGKSQITHQVAAALDRPVIDVRAVLLDPVDLRGLPHVRDGKAAWAIPDFLPVAERDGEQGVLFLDELNAAPQLVQAACYQLVLDRKLGEYELPAGWSVVAAGNRETDRAVTARMPTPLANRFCHFAVEPDLKDWSAWAAAHGVAGEIIAFLRYRPELLHAFDPKSGEKAFPTPRSWEFVNRVIGAPDAVRMPIMSGIVGQGAAVEFGAFLKLYRTLPDIQDILLNPSTAPVPKADNPGLMYAISSALGCWANEDNFERIYTYGKRLPPEFLVFAMTDAVNRDRSLTKTGPWTRFGIEFQDVML